MKIPVDLTYTGTALPQCPRCGHYRHLVHGLCARCRVIKRASKGRFFPQD